LWSQVALKRPAVLVVPLAQMERGRRIEAIRVPTEPNLMSRSAPAIEGDGVSPCHRSDPTWFGALLALLMAAASFVAVPVSAQTTGDAAVRQAISAYEAGELERALAMLNAIPSSLPARDAAVRSLYQGLIHFAFGDANRARDAFARAVVLEPRLALNPEIHSPARIRAFEAARDSVVETWRTAAAGAEANGDLQRASRQWQNVLLAVPDDTTAASRLVAINTALAAPPQMSAEPPPPETRTTVDSARTDSAAVRPTPPAAAPPRVVQVYDPGQAALLGIIFPGLGEFYTGRKLRGALLMGAAVGAVAFGFMTESVEVQCLSVPVNNFCPPEDVVGERVTRPYLAPSVGVAAALTVVGAIDAYFGARRANARAAAAAGGGTGDRAGGARLERPALVPTPHDLRIELLRVRF
jgi:tetratricopeptide (TPR) repeat protein